MPSVVLAGYTNAGKSSLLKPAHWTPGLLVENALFATLDPTVRRCEAADGRQYTLADTVGFVRHLPTQLVEAFRSTLEEVADADLILHVVDATGSDGSDPGGADRRRARGIHRHRGHVGARTAGVQQGGRGRRGDDAAAAPTGPGGPVRVRPHRAGHRRAAGRDRRPAARPDIEITALVPYDRGDLLSRLHDQATSTATRTRPTAPWSPPASTRGWPAS